VSLRLQYEALAAAVARFERMPMLMQAQQAPAVVDQTRELLGAIVDAIEAADRAYSSIAGRLTTLEKKP
jgi:hypothetical protein